MREIALAGGVPERAILLEPRSRNTFENAVETAQLMRSKGLKTLVLVSDRYHLPRARLLFRRAGLIVRATAHPPPRGLWRDLPLAARESLAFGLSLWRLLRANLASSQTRKTV
ncbi:MAG: YdcF family protein, partial [Alphaproteobacteria bacterium]|nr:YdcF family protein [Alphaproteobacteria bacterium]